MAYGSLAGVGVLVPRFSGDGAFTATTRPASATVTSWLASVSGILNAQLATSGFTVAVTDADVTPILDLFVNEEVAALVEGVNGSGRFGPTAKEGKGEKGRFALILDDVKAFVAGNAYGLEVMGAARPHKPSSMIGYRDTDEAGSETFPLFQRKSHGETFSDWDSDNE